MRPLALAALCVLLAPFAVAHGTPGLHLHEVRLAYDPLLPGQTLTFVVENERDLVAEPVWAHVTLRDAQSRTMHYLDPLPARSTVEYTLPLSTRVAPQACLFVASMGMSTEQVCALATTPPAVRAP